MKSKILSILLFFIISLLPGICLAQNKVKVAVIPLIEEVQCKCTGILRGGRWCDNGDGTITDMSTCLVWLKTASWQGLRPQRNDGDCAAPLYTCYKDAHLTVSLLESGYRGANLSDGSIIGQWRLPTFSELSTLTKGESPIRCEDSPTDIYGFTDVCLNSNWYWTSTTNPLCKDQDLWCQFAMSVNIHSGNSSAASKTLDYAMWPVRTAR